MINSNDRLIRTLVVLIGLVFIGLVFSFEHNTSAQDSGTEGLSGLSYSDVKNTKDIKTLEQVRELGGLETGLRPILAGTGSQSADVLPDVLAERSPRSESISPRNLAMARIRDLQRRLSSPDADHAELKPQLKAALAEYFIADMRHRVHELDEIKAKVAETEAKLQKRLESQQDAVDLQFKIMLREAEGFGFFHKEDARSWARFGSAPGMQGQHPGVLSKSIGLGGPPHIPLGAPAGLTKPSPPKSRR